MQLTLAADYAVRVMIRLASLPGTERAMLADLALATGAPESFLYKVLQFLCRAGLAASHRGQFGGFEILPAGRAATIATVMQAIEGPINLNVCMDEERYCKRMQLCPAHPVWQAAQAAMLAVLNEGTIQDLADRLPAR
jgi:Rrf2 family protein